MNKKFVSRAGKKLQFALEKFNIDVSNLVVADFGSSTGGFVDCLLQNGAKKVYAVDTCYGELDWNLRNNERVVVMERTNAMHVTLPEKVDLITIDTAWTKQEKVLPNAFLNLKSSGFVISLIKPHYEDPDSVVHGKLQEDKLENVIENVSQKITNFGGKIKEKCQSPLVGGKGKNTEYLFLIYQ